MRREIWLLRWNALTGDDADDDWPPDFGGDRGTGGGCGGPCVEAVARKQGWRVFRVEFSRLTTIDGAGGAADDEVASAADCAGGASLFKAAGLLVTSEDREICGLGCDTGDAIVPCPLTFAPADMGPAEGGGDEVLSSPTSSGARSTATCPDI